MDIYVDLNSDLGEGFGNYQLGMDKEVMEYVTSVNVACAFHAGDPLLMEKTVKLAKEQNVFVGAHPGYPDLLGFGRRKMAINAAEARAYMLYQAGALSAFTAQFGLPLQHIKLHGAFYNTVSNEPKLADAVLDGLEKAFPQTMILALSGSYIAKEAVRRNIPVAQEVFADRGYNDDGTLVPRSEPGAFVKDPVEAVERVVEMVKNGTVQSVQGKTVHIAADSICVHGDNPQAIEFTKKIREGLEKAGITVAPLLKWKK